MMPTIKDTENNAIVSNKPMVGTCSMICAVVFILSPSNLQGYYNIYPQRRERD